MEQLSRDPAYLPTQPLAPAARGLGLTAFQLVDPSRLPPQIWGTSEDQHWAFLLLATEGERRQTIQTLRSDGKSLADAIDAFTGFGKDAARGIREAVAIIEYRRVYEAMTGRKPTVTRPHADDPYVDFELAVDGGTPEPVDVKTPVPFDASLKSKPSDEEALVKVALRLAGNDALYADWLVEQAEPILEEVGTAHPTSKHVDGGFGGLFDKADEVAEASPGGPSEMINGTVIVNIAYLSSTELAAIEAFMTHAEVLGYMRSTPRSCTAASGYRRHSDETGPLGPAPARPS